MVPNWIKNVCAQPSWWDEKARWKQPGAVRVRDARFAVQTCGTALFAHRISNDDEIAGIPGQMGTRAATWLRASTPLRVKSRALLEFLHNADDAPAPNLPTSFMAFNASPVGIGPFLYNARLMLAHLSAIEGEWPDEVRIGWTAKTKRAVLLATPAWRYICMPILPREINCWRLEHFVRVRR